MALSWQIFLQNKQFQQWKHDNLPQNHALSHNTNIMYMYPMQWWI